MEAPWATALEQRRATASPAAHSGGSAPLSTFRAALSTFQSGGNLLNPNAIVHRGDDCTCRSGRETIERF